MLTRFFATFTRRRRPVVGLGVLAALVTLVFGPAGVASAQAQFFETVIARHSGQCLDVQGGSTDPGAPIIQWPCHGGTNQAWLPFEIDDGEYVFISQNSGQCLDVQGGSTDPGAPLIQWPCHGGGNQRFHLVPTGDGYVAIIAEHSDQCVDVQGGSTDPGTPIIQWPCHFGGNQQWRIS